jgi:hypothetical protein
VSWGSQRTRLAHGGSAVAWEKGAVRSKHTKAGAVRGKHIMAGAVTAEKLADGVSGVQGPPGAKGDTGPAGPAGSPDTAEQVRDKLKSADGSGSGLDADALDNLDSSDIGLGFFTGRLKNLSTLGDSAGPSSGTSQAASIPVGVQTLSPDRPIRLRELAGRLSTTAPGLVQVFLSAHAPGGEFITRLTCAIGSGASECTHAGPSAVIPARSLLVLEVSVSDSPLPGGTDLLFSWRAQAP